MRDRGSFNADVIAGFRTNQGVVDRFAGLPVLTLHTVGARSGQVWEITRIPVFDDDRMLLFGTPQGSAARPRRLSEIALRSDTTRDRA